MTRRKTHEEFVAEVKALVGDEYTVVGEYENSSSNIEMRHNVCGSIFKPRPHGFLGGSRCPICVNKELAVKKRKPKISESIAIKKLRDRHENKFTLQESFKGTHYKHKTKCNDCGHVWDVQFRSLLSKKSMQGCPSCSGNAKKTTAMFKKEVFGLVGKEYEIMSRYINAHTKVRVKHLKCGKEYKVTPHNFLQGKRCAFCFQSKGEKRIEEYLILKNIQYVKQYNVKSKETQRSLRVDFFIQGIAVEYDGEQHFKPIDAWGGESALRETQRRDRIKDKYCADNGIPLIRIPYWEYDNIDAILTEKLLPLLKDNNVNPTQKQAVGM